MLRPVFTIEAATESRVGTTGPLVGRSVPERFALSARHLATATGLAALLAASPEINFREFRAFVSGLQLREQYVGVDGIGFAQRHFARRYVPSEGSDGSQTR